MSRSSKVNVPSLAPFVNQSEGKMDISTVSSTSFSSSHSGKSSAAVTPRSAALEHAQPLVRLLGAAYKATTTHKIRAQAAAAGRPSDAAALSASSKSVCDAVQKIVLHVKAFSTYSAVDVDNVKGDFNICPPDGAHMPLLTQAIAIDLHGPVESEPIVPLLLAAYQDSVDVNTAWDVHNVSPLSYLRQEMRLYSQDDSATLCRRAVHIVEALVSFSELQVTTSLRFFCRLQPAAPSRTWERCMLEMIELLLHHPNCELNEKGLEDDSMYGMTALHACLRSCPLQLTEHYLHRRLQLLLKAGADVNLQYEVNGEYVTPLMMAFHAGLPLAFTEDDLVDLAAADAPAAGPTRKLAAKSSPDLFQHSALVLSTHSNVIPMLTENFRGAPQQPLKVLSALLEAGAGLNTPYVSSSELSGMTVAHLAVLFAAISHRTTLAQTKLSVLIEFGLNNEMDLTAVDGQGRTPVQLLQLMHKGARLIRDDRVDLVVQLIANAKRAAYEDHVKNNNQ